MQKMPLFVFGTLMDDELRYHVLGRHLSLHEQRFVTAAGWATYRYPGESFPILQRAANKQVYGLLLTNLTQNDWARIDFYEGDEYGFDRIWVQNQSGEWLEALYNRCDDNISSHTPWTLSAWQQQEKAGFLPLAEYYMSLYDHMTVEEADVIWQQMLTGEHPVSNTVKIA